MSRWPSCALLSVLLSSPCLACGGGSAPPNQTLVPLFEGARIDDARTHAAELMAQADAARDAALLAEQAGESEQAAELATEARLWLAAALASADQRSFEQERAADLAASAVAAQQTVALVNERERVVESEAQAQTGALAADAARQAFEHAAGYEARRLRRDDPETRALYRETSLVLQQRSAALLAAARALGAPADAAGSLDARLAELRRAPRAELVVEQADALLADALALLGQARAGHPVTPGERGALLEAARERGLTAVEGERGMELRGPHLDRAQAAGLRQVAGLLAAHPHGGVQILVIGPVARRSAGGRRATALHAGLLRAGVPAERLSIVEVVADVEAPGLALSLPAY